ncbi:MAG: cobyric acid synthase [Deltaproteobacteria bacterium]|nr:cobyric acid synthase [Candidatus Anaeroferrophillacea bacterium]
MFVEVVAEDVVSRLPFVISRAPDGGARLLMVQGTGSSVGKSVLVAGLCRLYAREGVRVAPFKAQNMALNSFITAAGREMGRAQVVQAEACGLAPRVDMNPVLIKPNSDVGAQVIIHGRPVGNMSAVDYHAYKRTAWKAVVESLGRLRAEFDLVIIEGAGSPAEINLRDGDIVNMGLATAVGAPVLLAGDIDKGGVFASLLGTMELLAPEERRLVKGFVINKFRGDVKLLKPGLDFIAGRCGVPVAGVVPWFTDLYLPEEDGVAVEGYGRGGAAGGPGADDGAASLVIGVVKLPHISNFTDFDPLLHEPGVRLDYLLPGDEPDGCDVLVIPGSKNTIDDLCRLRTCGWDNRLKRFAAAGGMVIGICGGYQMLGREITDPHGVESGRGREPGFGLLPAVTQLVPEKVTVQCRGTVLHDGFGAGGAAVAGYEIHMGRTVIDADLDSGAAPLLRIADAADGHPDGAVAAGGMVWGTYLHGIFDNDDFRRRLLAFLRRRTGKAHAVAGMDFADRKARGLDGLADLLAAHLDLELVAAAVAAGPMAVEPEADGRV